MRITENMDVSISNFTNITYSLDSSNFSRSGNGTNSAKASNETWCKSHWSEFIDECARHDRISNKYNVLYGNRPGNKRRSKIIIPSCEISCSNNYCFVRAREIKDQKASHHIPCTLLFSESRSDPLNAFSRHISENNKLHHKQIRSLPQFRTSKLTKLSNAKFNESKKKMRFEADFMDDSWRSTDEKTSSENVLHHNANFQNIHKIGKHVEKKISKQFYNATTTNTTTFDARYSSTDFSELSRRLSNTNVFVKKYFHVMNFQVKHKLKPYECEPGICVPGQCNPYECEKLIRKRLMKMSSTMTSSGNRTKSIFSETDRQYPVARAQDYKTEYSDSHDIQNESSNQLESSRLGNAKQAIRMGSTINFGVEFSADGFAFNKKNKKDSKQVCPGSVSKSNSLRSKRLKAKCNGGYEYSNKDGKSQSGIEMKHKGSMATPKHERCFCTLQLHKKRGIKIKSVNVPLKSVIAFKTKGQNTKNTKQKIYLSKQRLMETESSEDPTVVEITGDGLKQSTSILYDRVRGQNTTLVMVGGTDAECKVHQGRDAQETLIKYADRENEILQKWPKFKCAKTCTYCKLLNNKNTFPDAITYSERVTQTNKKLGAKTLQHTEPYGTRTRQDNANKNQIDKNGAIETQLQNNRRTPFKRINSSLQSVTHDALQLGRQLQAVRISSSFSFNVEFYRDKSLGDEFGDKNKTLTAFGEKNKALTTSDDTNKTLAAVEKLQYEEAEPLNVAEKPQAKHKKNMTSDKLMQPIVYRNQGVQSKAFTISGATKSGVGAAKLFKNQSVSVKSKDKDKKFWKMKPQYENSGNFTVVEVTGDGLTQSSSILYDRLNNQDTTVVMVGGTDAECKINRGRDAEEALAKYADRETVRPVRYKYKCAKKCTFCKMLNKENKVIDGVSYSERDSHTSKSNRKSGIRQVDRFECEPGFCVPGQCDPRVCAERIRNRPRNLNTPPSTKQLNSKSRNMRYRHIDTSKLTKNRRNNQIRHYDNAISSHYDNEETPNRNVVKLGSNFSFSIEFHKDKGRPDSVARRHEGNLDNDSYTSDTMTDNVMISKEQHASVPLNDSSSQLDATKKQNKGIRPLLKRCFCTLGIHGSSRKRKPIKTQSRGTASLINAVAPELGENYFKTTKNYEPGYSYESDKLMKKRLIKDATAKTGVERKPRYNLEPDECEPGTCVPGLCNPLECLKRIQQRRRNNHNTQTTIPSKSKETETMQLKRCFCTAKLFQQNGLKERYTVGRVDKFEILTPFIPRHKSFCNPGHVKQNQKHNLITKTNTINSENSTHNDQSVINNNRVQDSHVDSNQKLQYLIQKTKTLLQFVSKEFDNHKSLSSFALPIETKRTVKTSRDIITENNNFKGQYSVNITKQLEDIPPNIRVDQQFSKRNSKVTPEIHSNHTYITLEKQHNYFLKKSESERKRSIPSFMPRETKSLKIHKSKSSSTPKTQRSTKQYSLFQSGDASSYKTRLSVDIDKSKTLHKNALINKISTNAIKSINIYARKIIKNRTTNDITDVQIIGKGLKNNTATKKFNNKKPVCVSSEIIKFTDISTKYNSTATCSIKKYSSRIYQDQIVSNMERNEHVFKRNLNGFKFSVKGKHPQARVLTFSHKARTKC